MARYRKVDSRIWNDEKFLGLSDDGQLVFLFLLTHPHQTALGAMRATLPGLASEKGWLPERLSKAFAEALSKGMVKHDEKASCIWLPNFLKYNRPESPNVVKAWGSAADLIPECRLKIECIQTAKAFLKGFKEGFRKAFDEVFGEALAKDYALSGSGTGAGTVTGTEYKEPPQPPLRGVSAGVGARGREGKSPGTGNGAVGAGSDAWRDVTECDPRAYESWLEYRAAEGDPVPAKVRLEHAKWLGGRGTPEQQRELVATCIRLQFKRLHDPIQNASRGPSGAGPPKKRWHPDDGDPTEPKT